MGASGLFQPTVRPAAERSLGQIGAAGIVANSGNSLQQVHWLDPQGMRQTHNVQQRDIPFPALDSANIIAMQGR